MFALGETYLSGPLPIVHLGSSDTDEIHTSAHNNASASADSLPGTGLFEQALSLLHVSYEEPTVELIETLNMIVSPSWKKVWLL